MTEPVDPGRRAFVTGQLLEEKPPPAPPLGPAPPWLAEVISPAVCGDCAGPCVEACPERIVLRHPENHPQAGRAYLDFQLSACTFCRACVDVCPVAPSPLPEGRALAAVTLDTGTCLAAKGIVCVMCVARCPERAVRAGPSGAVSIEAAACTGCGACIPACPVDALASVERVENLS